MADTAKSYTTTSFNLIHRNGHCLNFATFLHQTPLSIKHVVCNYRRLAYKTHYPPPLKNSSFLFNREVFTFLKYVTYGGRMRWQVSVADAKPWHLA